MMMNWFWRKDNAGTAKAVESPDAVVAAPRPSLWHRMGVVRLFARTKKTPDGTEVSTTIVTQEFALDKPVVSALGPLPARPVARSAWRKWGDWLAAAGEWI